MIKISNISIYIALLFFVFSFSDSNANNNEIEVKLVCSSNSNIKHSGGTDKCGCHTNRKTGEYHCHNRKQRGGDCPP
tara:strand:+ start:780 stop:1010 length:231 start_codon:yes stop_codon:yes gene_type:complete